MLFVTGPVANGGIGGLARMLAYDVTLEAPLLVEFGSRGGGGGEDGRRACMEGVSAQERTCCQDYWTYHLVVISLYRLGKQRPKTLGEQLTRGIQSETAAPALRT
jgi:hypothetical protein